MFLCLVQVDCWRCAVQWIGCNCAWRYHWIGYALNAKNTNESMTTNPSNEFTCHEWMITANCPQPPFQCTNQSIPSTNNPTMKSKNKQIIIETNGKYKCNNNPNNNRTLVDLKNNFICVKYICPNSACGTDIFLLDWLKMYLIWIKSFKWLVCYW